MDEPGERKRTVTPTRIGIWVVVAGIGLYMIVSGLIGVINAGG